MNLSLDPGSYTALDALPGSVLDAVKSIDWRTLRGVRQESGRICVIEFDADAFDPAAFLDAGIACPATVARSVPVRQAEFFFGRLAARMSLTELGVERCDVPIGPAREPLWPAPVVGSITHNQHFAAAVALVECTSVGIDIERVVSPESQQALLVTAISAKEQSYLRTLACESRFAHLITAVFSAKESFFKAAFRSVGRYFDFSAAEVVHVDTEKLCMSLVLREALSQEFFVGKIVRVHMDYVRPDTLLTSLVGLAGFVDGDG
jgi:4'-phosphopantetheinyl transferase EntD